MMTLKTLTSSLSHTAMTGLFASIATTGIAATTNHLGNSDSTVVKTDPIVDAEQSLSDHPDDAGVR